MFERFTETARKVVFIAKNEAHQFGSENVESEHLLLGILRTEYPLALRLLKRPEKIASIRQQIETQFPPRAKVSTPADLPLSHQCKRVLAYGAEEAERLNHKQIAAEHLLLGLLREEASVASKILVKAGLSAAQLRQEAIRLSTISTPATTTAVTSSLTERSRNLTAAARNAALSPLIGRERELERMIQILSRRSRNNPVLIGEPGVGKNTIVHGLAQRIADGVVPAVLAERPILAIDASSLISSDGGGELTDITKEATILYIQGLFDLAGKTTGWGVLEAMHVLVPHLAHGTVQCIATGTPFGFRQTMEKAETLASHFEVVGVLPPTEEEAIEMVWGVKEQYEKFHDVVITKEAIEAAVAASRWFLRHSYLPERAIDLIDEAGARVRLRSEGDPRDIVEIRKRIRLITRQMENAIANHEFQKARVYSDEEQKERQNLQRLSEELKQDPARATITPVDIVETVAERAGVPVSLVKNVQTKETGQLEFIAKELAAHVPLASREWVEGLATYLAGCSEEEAEKLAQTIRTAKAQIG
jgi:ATP-dependent Clp protease ATP-binding subunit ClpC